MQNGYAALERSQCQLQLAQAKVGIPDHPQDDPFFFAIANCLGAFQGLLTDAEGASRFINFQITFSQLTVTFSFGLAGANLLSNSQALFQKNNRLGWIA